MGLTNAGRDFIASAIINNGSPTFFTNANAYIGVGNDSGSDAFAATQTDLMGASKTRNGMVAEYPSIADNAITFRSSFATGEANHDWAEWGVFNHTSAGTMLNRVVENLGTKTQGVWVLTVTLTITLG